MLIKRGYFMLRPFFSGFTLGHAGKSSFYSKNAMAEWGYECLKVLTRT